MTQTIRIRKTGPRNHCFEVENKAGHRIATSVGFDTICRLESRLATLTESAQSSASAVVERDAQSTSIGPPARRNRVRFVGNLSDDGLIELLSGVRTAKIVDERPAAQRRDDLTGRLCDLGH